MRYLFLFLILSLPKLVWAVGQPVVGSKALEPLSTTNLIQWTLGLFVVLVFMGVIAWIARRMIGLSVNQTTQLRVLASLSLGHREKTMLVRAGDTHLLLGVSPGRVQTLHVFEVGEIKEGTAESTLSFQQSLRKVLRDKASI